MIVKHQPASYRTFHPPLYPVWVVCDRLPMGCLPRCLSLVLTHRHPTLSSLPLSSAQSNPSLLYRATSVLLPAPSEERASNHPCSTPDMGVIPPRSCDGKYVRVLILKTSVLHSHSGQGSQRKSPQNCLKSAIFTMVNKYRATALEHVPSLQQFPHAFPSSCKN